MQGFPGAATDLCQLQSTMQAVEYACSLIQIDKSPVEAEKVFVSLCDSIMPYQSCLHILENSRVPMARFLAAAAIRNAAFREWGILSDENKRFLILYCLHYVLEHTGSSDSYVQSKVSSVAAQLLKRGWQDFANVAEPSIFFKVRTAIIGDHGIEAQFAGINFLETLVSEFSLSTSKFSLSTSTAMGLPAEDHVQHPLSLEKEHLMRFYSWAEEGALNLTKKILRFGLNESENQVCSAALCLMFQILDWKVIRFVIVPSNYSDHTTLSPETLVARFEWSVRQAGTTWHADWLSNKHILRLLNLYAALRTRHSSDVIWIDSPLAVAARQLIVKLSSWICVIFSSDDGKKQVLLVVKVLEAICPWICTSFATSAATRFRQTGGEIIDACHVLLSLATLTTTRLFDVSSLKQRFEETVKVLSILTTNVLDARSVSNDKEHSLISEALDIILEAWSIIIGRTDSVCIQIPQVGIDAAGRLFINFVESLLCAAADDIHSHFHAPESGDKILVSCGLIARPIAETTIPFLIKLLSERVEVLLDQTNGGCDTILTLKELSCLLLITGHVLTDSPDVYSPGGNTIPGELLVKFQDRREESSHPIVTLSRLILDFAKQSLYPETRTACFSPRLMEAMIWFLSKWANAYLMPRLANGDYYQLAGQLICHKYMRRVIVKSLYTFAGEHVEGKIILDNIVDVCRTALTSYPGEKQLQVLSCHKLLAALVRRKNICYHLIKLDSWHNLTRSFADDIFFPIDARLQRSLVGLLLSAATGFNDPEKSNEYVRDLMKRTTTVLVDISTRNYIKDDTKQSDSIYVVSCSLERLRGAARATQPQNHGAILEICHTVMMPLLTLLEMYKNQSAVVYLLLKFVADFVYEQDMFLNHYDASVLFSFCMQLLQRVISHNMVKIPLSLSTSFHYEAEIEKYKGFRALLHLLRNICSKNLAKDSEDIAKVIHIGFPIISPLISMDFQDYPKLSHDYFAIVSRILEVHPKKFAQLDHESFLLLIGIIDSGIQNQDSDFSSMCLGAVNRLATYHYRERTEGKDGFGGQSIISQQSNCELQESISSHFLRKLLHLLLFEDFRMELADIVADAFFSLLLCEHDLFQRLAQELKDSQSSIDKKKRLAKALDSLTSSNQLSYSLDRLNRQKFRKNLRVFLIEVSGFMRTR